MRKSRQTAAPRAHRTNNIRRRARCRRSSGAQETASRYPIPIPWHSPSCLARSKTTNWRSQFCNRFKVLVNVASPWSGSTPLRPSAPRCTNGSDIRQARDLGGGQVHIERLRACALCIRAPTCGCRPLTWRRRPNRRPRSRCEDSDQTRHAPAIASGLEPRGEKVAAKTRRSPKSAVSRHSSFAAGRFALGEPLGPIAASRTLVAITVDNVDLATRLCVGAAPDRPRRDQSFPRLVEGRRRNATIVGRSKRPAT